MSKFFVDRPVLATVISILILLAGTVSILTLPVAQLPEITPPTIQIIARYPGASAETVAQSVAAPIEQQLSGALNLLYFQSFCANDGTLTTNVTFEIGSNLELAQVDVQNRVNLAMPQLPEEVKRQGVTVKKMSTAMLLVATLESDDPRYDDLYLANYATIYLLDQVKRISGVGDALVYGSRDYAMRIWLDPDRLAQKLMTVTDLKSAISEQNGLFAAGRIGGRPGPAETQLTMPVITRGRLAEPSEFEEIILRANPDGSMVRIQDVGRAELGSRTYDLFGRKNGKPTALLILYLLPGANALETAEHFEQLMREAAPSFPSGVRYSVPYDTTAFVRVSVEGVVHTLLEAVVLVLVVVFLFLQSWRATLIPLLAVPVSIVGTFGGMLALGFSINTLTLFGLVLAIGIVVDDAIVVVENVERIMHEKKLAPREATIEAMQQVSGPVIAIVLVLSAVFVPVAFMSGMTGQLYQQFAVTIAVSVALSGIVALTLTPALCRLLLRPGHGEKRGFFKWFNQGFDALTRGYTHMVRTSLKLAIVGIVLFGALIWGTLHLFRTLPTGFLPDEDQGYLITMAILPPGASVERTNVVTEEIEQHVMSLPEVADVITLGGMDQLSGGSASTSTAALFVVLKPWDERKGEGQDALSLQRTINRHFAANTDALIVTFNPPSVPGLGTTAGFEFQMQARGISDVRALAEVRDQFLAKLRQRPEVAGATSTFNVRLPQLYIDVDRSQTKSMGLSLTEVFNTLQTYFGSLYVADFDKFGRIWQVQLMAEPKFRSKPEDIGRMYVRNDELEMVPISSVLSQRYQSGPNIVTRFNGFPAASVTGAPAAGRSTGEAMNALRETASEVLPPGYGYEWSAASYQEIKAGNQAPIILGLGLLIVFLILAAQYESWSLPFAVLLAVPFGIFGALVAVLLRGLSVDVYFQIGLLTLVGLAAKNAILIVEFCADLHRAGKPIAEAAIEAARLRLRPIIMTSLAFILGVVPLAISTGAGAAGRVSIGTGVLGGMLCATFLAVFFVPLFFVLIEGMTSKLSGKKAPQAELAAGAAHSG